MEDLDYVATRYFNVYGPRMDIHGAYTEVLIRWMELIEEGKPPIILGDGHQTMDFVYVDDAARATILAAQSPSTDVVVNVASGTETSLNELAEALVKTMDSTVEPVHLQQRKVNPVSRRRADTRRAKALLGFEAEVQLEEGLSRLVSWWRADRLAAGGS
jgi:UDP-glucose 4-epimerase